MRRGMTRLVLGLGVAASGVVGGSAPALAQSFSSPVIARMPPSPSGGSGQAGGGPGLAGGNPAMFANPYANPYMNPYLNPWMTQMPSTGNRSDALMFFMAAQRAQGGFGSPYGLGGSGGLGTSGAASPGGSSRLSSGRGGGQPGMAGQGAAGVRPGPVDRSARPRTQRYVAGRFDSNPAFHDGRGRLAGQYSAFGSTTHSQDGRPLVPDGAPVANDRVRRQFNHYPSYNANNGR